MTKKKSLEWLNCSEKELVQRIEKWAQAIELKNTIVFLKGEMGMGKSTFARFLLTQLSPGFSSQGSPTFPLVQQYASHEGYAIYHIDLYRLKNENELEDSGILYQIEEPGALALVEWPDLFADSFVFWMSDAKNRSKNVIEISISGIQDLRDYSIKMLNQVQSRHP